MRFCRNCGKPLEDHQTYCNNCGKVFDQESFIVESKQKKEEIQSEDQIAEYSMRIQETEKDDESLKIPLEYGDTTSQHITQHDEQPPINNWIKVLLSVMVPGLPGLGAIIGIIASIIFMSKTDQDRRSFGHALLTFSILFFLIFCSCAFLFYFSIQEAMSEFGDLYYNY